MGQLAAQLGTAEPSDARWRNCLRDVDGLLTGACGSPCDTVFYSEMWSQDWGKIEK